MKIRFTDLIKENKILVEGRVEDAKAKYPRMPDEVFNVFMENDPSGNHKYLPWLIKIWWAEKCERWIDNASSYYIDNYCKSNANLNKLMDGISYFHEKPSKFTQTDINQFNGISTFLSAVSEAKIKLTKGELKKQAKKLYETDRYLVVEPHSHASSCYYGAGTQWCTTMKNHSSYFDSYYKSNSLLYFINKKTGKKRAFLTNITTPMFGPGSYGNKSWVYAGDREYRNYTGTIYTETDNQGRSLRGIPEEARVAMQNGHKEKAKKWAKEMDDGRRKIELMTALGMEDIPVMTSVDSWDTNSGPIPESVTNVDTDLIIRGDASLGNVKTIGGRLLIDVNGNFTITGVETVGSLALTSGNISLGSLRGELSELTLSNSAKLVNAGGVTKIGQLSLRNMNVTKVLLNSLEIEEINFNNMTAQTALGKLFKNSVVSVDRW